GDVAVAATISGGKPSGHSPVVIERRNNVLLISVAMTSDPLRGLPARVNLDVLLPETVRAEIVTGSGVITSRGVSTALSLKTISGAIHAELAPLDLDLIAQSTEGRVRSEIGGGAGSDSHIFRS